MKLIPVDSIPEIHKPADINSRHDVQEMLKDFMESGIDIAEVYFKKCDYKSARVCANSIDASIRRLGYSVRVFKRGDKVYLKKYYF